MGHGAVTIVNAIPFGRGIAMGIDLRCEAVVRVDDSVSGIKVALQGEAEGEDTHLAELAVSSVLSEVADDGFGAEVRCLSQIPPGVGLKSSSASSNVITHATYAAIGRHPSSSRVIRKAVEASLRAGVSVTGAFDDACACFFGGIFATDNLRRKILKRERGTHTKVLIHVPNAKRYTRNVNADALRSLASCYREVFDLAIRRHTLEALTLNGILTAAALKIDPTPAIVALKNGAKAAGISGNGPSTVALLDDSSVERVADAWGDFDGRILRASTTNDMTKATHSD